MSILPRAAVAVVFFALSTVAAYAISATTRVTTRVYDGPSTKFDVITILPPDTDIEVIGCSRGWCEVDLEDQEGFVRQRSLDFYEGMAPVIIFPPVVYQYGWNYWRYYYRGDWERWRGRYGRPQRPYVAPKVPPRGPRPGQPNVAPQIPRPTQPNIAPPSSRQGPPSGGPSGAPRLQPRNDRPSAPQRPQDPGQPSPPGDLPAPGGVPAPGGMPPPR